MIVCPNCGNKEMPGAIICQECGTQLLTTISESTIAIPGSISDHIREQLSENEGLDVPPTPDNAELSLFLIDTGEVIALEGLSEYTIGRSAEDQPILPDIDLTPFHGYENGVSRLHASIKIDTPSAILTDFDSANGTQLNGQKILPHKPYPITHGDIITLGKIKFQLLVNR